MMDPDAKEGGPLQEAGRNGSAECGVASPFRWLRRPSRELHWSFVLAVFAVYGACQGVGNAVGVVAASYYSKDVLRLQPSAAQLYQGIVDSPWVVKPIWGLLADVVPVAGYRRRPYFLLAGDKIGLHLFSIPPHQHTKIGFLRNHFICQYVP